MVTGDGPYAVVEVLDGAVAVATLHVTAAVPGLFVVDAVARLHLAARRLGWSVRLCTPDADLRALLDLAGLSEVVPAPLLLEPRGQAEGREEAGVEEVVQPGEPLA